MKNVLPPIVLLVGLIGASAASPAAPAQRAFVVQIADFKFTPGALRVRAGDRVTFVNDDAAAHTATANDRSFDSGNLDQHQTWTFIFAKPGTYSYVCLYHRSMKGAITVEPADAGADGANAPVLPSPMGLQSLPEHPTRARSRRLVYSGSALYGPVSHARRNRFPPALSRLAGSAYGHQRHFCF